MIDMSCFDVTSDGSMVRVDMLGEVPAMNDPVGLFVDINQALYLEAQGKCRIRRKMGVAMANHPTDGGGTMVEHLEQALVDSYGKFAVYKKKEAVRGEKIGKWKIIKDPAVSYALKDSEEKEDSRKTKGVKKAKVAWIQDNFILGGAELSNHLVSHIGIDCGYDVDLVTPSMSPQVIGFSLKESDLIIVNNIFGFEKEQMQVLLRELYFERRPYVKYEHDHRELGRVDFSRRLFQNSKLNIFLSPIHLKNHQEVLGCDGIALPLAIDVDLFQPVKSVKRKEGTAVVCNVRNFKSWENLQKYIDNNQGIEFTIMASSSSIRGVNVKLREKVPYEKMPELYSEFEYVVHLLDGWGAGERVVFEGALCGCKVVANKRVGHASWDKDLTDSNGLREWLRAAPYRFWKEVERRILC